MGTLALIILRFVLGWKALTIANYQIFCLTLSMDTIALLLFLSWRSKKTA